MQRLLARSFVNVGVAYRDFAIDISVSRFRPGDVRHLRNLMQAVIRSLLLLKTDTRLFDNWDFPEASAVPAIVTVSDSDSSKSHSPTESSSGPADAQSSGSGQQDTASPRTVSRYLAGPTREVLSSMKATLLCCKAALMDISGYRSSLGPPENIPLDIEEALSELQRASARFDRADDELNGTGDLALSSGAAPEVTELLVFSRYIRMAAASIHVLGTHVRNMKRNSTSSRMHLPSYPLRKIVNYSNAQVRHDGGGVVASMFRIPGFPLYFFLFLLVSFQFLRKKMRCIAYHSLVSYKGTFRDIWALIESIKSRQHRPPSSRALSPWPSISTANTTTTTNMKTIERTPTRMETDEDPGPKSKRRRIMFRIWRVLHRLQGFETKYAVKVCLLTVSLAVPAWAQHSRGWWNQYETWWAVVTAWLMVHPRFVLCPFSLQTGNEINNPLFPPAGSVATFKILSRERSAQFSVRCGQASHMPPGTVTRT